MPGGLSEQRKLPTRYSTGDGWMEEEGEMMDGWMDGWMDRQTDEEWMLRCLRENGRRIDKGERKGRKKDAGRLDEGDE